MTPPERAFLEEARTATLATIGPDGLPRLVPICFVLAADGAVVTPIDEKSKRVRDPYAVARVRDIAARPEVALLVDRWSEDWDRLAWFRLRGRAALLRPGDDGHAEAVAALKAKYPQYAGHDLEARPMIRITIDAARSWGEPD